MMRVNLGKTNLMVRGMEEETFDSKIDPCGMCGTRVMSNSVLCTACGKWVHARCTDRKKVAVCLNKNFVCKKCRSVVKNFKRLDEILCDGVETVSKFSYLGDRLNATGGCETAVTDRTKIGWMTEVKQDASEKKDDNFEKNRTGNDMSDMWCEATRSKKQRGVDGHVGHKGVYR